MAQRADQVASRRAARTPRARGASARGARRSGPPAEQLPVARIAVDVPLAHLDRPFDYLVPQRLAAAAVPGCRVRVRFAGQLTGGYLLERVAASEHRGRLAYLERVVSPEPVLSAEIAALAREVADRGAGTLADVLRLAIPPRHAGAEAAAARRAARAPGARTASHRGRPGRSRERAPGRSRVRCPGRSRGRGRVTRPGRRSWPRSRRAGLRGRSGRRCPGRTGRTRSRSPPRRRDRRGGARSSWCLTPGTWASSTAPCPARSDRASTSASRPGSGPPNGTGAGWPWPAGPCGWRPAPAPPCSLPSATSAWLSSGTTGTTCTPSRAPPTPTRGRSSRCGRTGPARGR